ncbi:hypothetical protein BD770DRAFT_398052 [Pilaira anomala]|nr:hypothetical protein BD770DRAFT_398052 [Pilaira anomala]
MRALIYVCFNKGVPEWYNFLLVCNSFIEEDFVNSFSSKQIKNIMCTHINNLIFLSNS